MLPATRLRRRAISSSGEESPPTREAARRGSRALSPGSVLERISRAALMRAVSEADVSRMRMSVRMLSTAAASSKSLSRASLSTITLLSNAVPRGEVRKSLMMKTG